MQTPEQVAEEQERKLTIARAYQEVASTQAGKIMLEHLRKDVLFQDTLINPGPNERAQFFAAYHDAWLVIKKLLNFDPRTQQKPVVHHKPHSQYPGGHDAARGRHNE